MLDQRLVRENPELVATQLGRRGMHVDLSSLQEIAQHQLDLEQQRSTLQAEGNRIGKEVGLKIKGGADPKGGEVAELRQQGNAIKQKVSVLEDEEKQVASQLKTQLLTLPNLPSADSPDGRDENDNIEVRRWGTPASRRDWRNTGRLPTVLVCWTANVQCALPRADSSLCSVRVRDWSAL